jgi:hypothetical protein
MPILLLLVEKPPLTTVERHSMMHFRSLNLTLVQYREETQIGDNNRGIDRKFPENKWHKTPDPSVYIHDCPPLQ